MPEIISIRTNNLCDVFLPHTGKQTSATLYNSEKTKSRFTFQCSSSTQPPSLPLSLPVLRLKGNLCGMCFVNLS